MATILVLLLGLSGFAQIDIKKLDRIGETAILRALGNPAEKWNYTDIDHYPCLGTATIDGYGPSGCEIVIHPKDKELLFFDTESPKYCVLSDIVPGGIKVGSKLTVLQRYNFSKTKYGRNKTSNNLMLSKQKMDDPAVKEYKIFGSEYKSITLYVKNGIVTGWQFRAAESDFETNYDKSVDFF